MHKNLIERVIAILKQPKLEWPVIAAEPGTIGDIYKSYVFVLAAVPAVCGLIATTMIGTRVWMFGTFRVSFASGLSNAVLQYLLSLVTVYVLAVIIEALAPNFGGEKNRTQAFKTAAYAATAAWVGGVGVLVPVLGRLLAIAGAIYSIYLLWLALPVTMKAPQDKATGYTAVTIIAAVVLNIVVFAITAGAMRGAWFGGNPYAGATTGSFDRDSALGKMEQWSKNMEAAGKKLDEAQKSGDGNAQGKALGAMMSAAVGGKATEALAPDRMKEFLPETLAGLPRTSVSAQRNGAIGIQVSTAEAHYSDGTRNLDLEITDSGGAAGLMAFAGWAAVESESEDADGYERTRTVDGRIVHEKWRKAGSGEFSTVVGQRFVVEVKGDAPDPEALRKMIGEVNVSGLDALKNEGVAQ